MLAVDARIYRRPMAEGHVHEKHPSLSFFLMPDYINGVAWHTGYCSNRRRRLAASFERCGRPEYRVGRNGTVAAGPGLSTVAAAVETYCRKIRYPRRPRDRLPCFQLMVFLPPNAGVDDDDDKLRTLRKTGRLRNLREWGGRADDGMMRYEDDSHDSGGLAVIDRTRVCVILTDAIVAGRLRTFSGTLRAARACVTLYKLAAKPRQPSTATVAFSCR